MDSGCSFPITSTAVAEALGAEVKPLTKKLEIIDASDRIMEIIGTIKMFIDNRVLGGRKLVEAAVVRSNKKETLISLSLLKKWDLVHESFPHQTVSDFIAAKKNKVFKAYSPAYDFHSSLYEENRVLRKPSPKCSKLRENLMGEYSHLFKEELEPTDRMKVDPVKLKLKEGFVNPSFCSKPFDIPTTYARCTKKRSNVLWTQVTWPPVASSRPTGPLKPFQW